METRINFQGSDKLVHPDSAFLKTTPLSQLILEKVESDRRVFGSVDFISVEFLDDNKSAVVYISPDCGAKWRKCKQLDLKSYMFDENPLSEKTKSIVTDFFNQFY